MRSTHFVSNPAHALTGTVLIPGDKSISHRSIMFASIAEGSTDIYGFLESEDCLATLAAFRAMGVKMEGPNEGFLRIHGVGKFGLKKPVNPIDCQNAGTSMRLLAGLLAGQAFDSTLIGDSSLTKRPMERISKPLQLMGAEIRTNHGCAPLKIHGSRALHGIHYEMPQASAQVKSCLLLAGLYATGETTILEPELTRDHTEQMLTAFSYPVERDDHSISLTGDSVCKGTTIKVPGDISSAAFFIVAATIIPGSDVLMKSVGINPTRTGIIQILELMGADITLLNQRTEASELVADIRVSYSLLKGITIPTDLIPLAIDEFPVIFIAAACASGETRLNDAAELRCKETDRIDAMAEGLRTLGVELRTYPDGISIYGGVLNGGEVDSCGDHRIAMAFAIAGAAAKDAVTINNTECVATSFPNFVTLANQIRLSIA